MSIPRKQPIAGLDIIRFAAAMLVVVYHLAVATWRDDQSMTARIVGGKATYPEILGIGWLGFVGVEIFFVVSGFVIVYSAAGSSPFRFLRSRILRLYPAAWMCATISLAAVGLFTLEAGPGLIPDYLRSIALFPLGPWIDSVYWTLGVEMAFYALIFCLLAAKRPGAIEACCYTVGVLSSIYWIVGAVVRPVTLERHLWDRLLELGLVSYGCYFALGVLLYFSMRRPLSFRAVAFGSLFVCAGLIETSYKARYNLQNLRLDEFWWTPAALYLLAVAAIVVSLHWTVSAAWSHRLRLVGTATYPLYLIHDNLGAVLLRSGIDAGLSRYPALAAAILCCVGVSFAVSAKLEPRLRTFLARGIDAAARLVDRRREMSRGAAS